MIYLVIYLGLEGEMSLSGGTARNSKTRQGAPLTCCQKRSRLLLPFRLEEISALSCEMSEKTNPQPLIQDNPVSANVCDCHFACVYMTVRTVVSLLE